MRTRTLSHIDRVVVRGFPALSVERAVIELAARLPEKELRVLIDSARRRGLLRIPRLRERAVELRSAAGSRRGSRAVLDLIGSGALAQESEAEREAARFLSTTTLELMWQVEDLVEGRRFDAVDHAARLILEIDSQLWHSLGSDRDADGLRDLETSDVAPGYVVVRLTLGMIRHHPDETRRRLDAIRGARLQGGR